MTESQTCYVGLSQDGSVCIQNAPKGRGTNTRMDKGRFVDTIFDYNKTQDDTRVHHGEMIGTEVSTPRGGVEAKSTVTTEEA